MIPLCRHIKTNGVRCRAAALSDKPYCYYHDRLHRALTRQKPTSKNSLVLHPLEDRSSILMALSEVICGLAAGRIDPRDAARLIYGLQVAGQFAPSSLDLPEDAVESFTVAKTGDELAPELTLCTEDDHCGSCPDSEDCDLKKAVTWRAAQADEDSGEEDDNVEDDDAAAGGNAA
jgi:hypothetical protein